MKYLYPVILEPDASGGFCVTVPDIFGGVTCGEDEADAIFMAKDLIRLMLTEAPAQCNPPRTLEETQRSFKCKRVVAVEVEI